MERYVDGFVLPIPKNKISAYRRIAKVAGKVWRKYGALDYKECIGDDLDIKGIVTFPRRAKAKPGETVVFSWITYKSRAHRDLVNKKVMKDPRMLRMMKDMTDPKKTPFDPKRMSMGGFKVLVEA
jgi:uncharacterized protein YbaA (DUF1428 family)